MKKITVLHLDDCPYCHNAKRAMEELNRQTMELTSKGCVLHKDLNTQNLNELRYVYETY